MPFPRTSYGFRREYEDLGLIEVREGSVAFKLGWSYQDMADHFEALDEHTKGMAHPHRVAFLANELSLLNDDEHLTTSAKLAWEIIEAWEAARGGRNQHVSEPLRSIINSFKATEAV